MKLWRLTLAGRELLDGSGPFRHGSRYSSPGRAIVYLTTEAALAVLVTLRYLPEDRSAWRKDYLLGWTEIRGEPERVPYEFRDDSDIRDWVDGWLQSARSLSAIVASKVLPEADIVMINPQHPDAAGVPPLVVRPFDFETCLHRPPMLDSYRNN